MLVRWSLLYPRGGLCSALWSGRCSGPVRWAFAVASALCIGLAILHRLSLHGSKQLVQCERQHICPGVATGHCLQGVPLPGVLGDHLSAGQQTTKLEGSPGLQGGGPSLDSLQLKDAPLEPLPAAAALPPPPNWSRNPCLIPAGSGHDGRGSSSRAGPGDQRPLAAPCWSCADKMTAQLSCLMLASTPPGPLLLLSSWMSQGAHGSQACALQGPLQAVHRHRPTACGHCGRPCRPTGPPACTARVTGRRTLGPS